MTDGLRGPLRLGPMTVCKRGPEDLLHLNDGTGVLLWGRSLPRGQWVERVPLSLGPLWHRVGIHLTVSPLAFPATLLHRPRRVPRKGAADLCVTPPGWGLTIKRGQRRRRRPQAQPRPKEGRLFSLPAAAGSTSLGHSGHDAAPDEGAFSSRAG